MSYYVDGVKYEAIHLPCGGTAYFDEGAGISYRCETCMATVGSIGMPSDCKAEIDKYEILKKLGGRACWDYNKGCEVAK